MLKRFSAIFLSIALFGEPILASQDDQITTPCNAHMGSIMSTEPHDYEKYFEFAKVPESAARFANEKLPNTVEIIAVAPVTPDEYKTIFVHGKKAPENITEAQTKEVEGVRSTLKATLGRDHGDRDFDKKNYESVLQAKTASFVIVIGHNDRGLLRLLDGNIVFLDDIVAAARPNQRVILISCDSAKQVSNKEMVGTINREVTYDEAFGIAGRISAFIKGASGPLSLVDAQSQLAKDETIAKVKKLAFFIMQAACAGASGIMVALIIRELDPCKDKDSSRCPQNEKKGGTKPKERKQSTDWWQLAPTCPHFADAGRSA